MDKRFDVICEVNKFNPYHDAKGRFASADSATLFTYAPGKSKAHDIAIQREKERHAADSSETKKLDKPIMFNQSGQRVKVTELTEENGEKSCKAQSMKIGQDWTEITDPKRLQGIRNTVDGMKKYEGKSTEELQSEYKRLKAISNDAYQQATRSAASRTGSLVSTFAVADTEMRQIKAVLDNRRLTVGKSADSSLNLIEEV